ncbi:MAG: Zn-dependent exopeptidase M28 [Spirochaetes bacterium]|nr:Zn-dependent exopeptidase M28 [Spirochaetota bacterium]MBU1081384.1 Zn-dependent exopeptidase M28 [Spirochaetota bacterium]
MHSNESSLRRSAVGPLAAAAVAAVAGGAVVAYALAFVACSARAVPGDRSGDSVSAIAVVRELSGEAYGGRQAGSDGGRAAAEYIAATLEGVGLSVAFRGFEEMVPELVREPRCAIAVPGGPERELRFREEFRESPRGARVEERAVGPLAYLSSADDDFPEGAVVVVPGYAYDEGDDEALVGRGAVGLLVVVEAASVERRSTYPGQGPRLMAEPKGSLVKMAVSEGVAAFLASAAASGATATLVNPLGFERRACRNVLATWNGDGGAFEPDVAFVAHYDHVGVDRDGAAFPGASDNASGVGLAMSLAENYARDRVRRDAAFLFTDAEEINLSGAEDFAASAPFGIARLKVVNLDMVGLAGSGTLSIYSNGDPPSREFAQSLARALSDAGIATRREYPVPNVDSGPLGRAGARAVTLCEFDQSVYHTKRDGPDSVSEGELDRLETALYAFALGL